MIKKKEIYAKNDKNIAKKIINKYMVYYKIQYIKFKKKLIFYLQLFS